MTTLITADHYVATTQAVEAAITAALPADADTVEIECLSSSARLAVESHLHDACDDERGATYTGTIYDEDEDVERSWIVSVVDGIPIDE
jgi:hypothetical protein